MIDSISFDASGISNPFAFSLPDASGLVPLELPTAFASTSDRTDGPASADVSPSSESVARFQAAMGMPSSTATTQKPGITTDTSGFAVDMPKPAINTQDTTFDMPEPTTDTQKPATDTQRTTADTQRMAVNAQKPVAGTQRMAADVQKPAVDAQRMAVNTPMPAADTQRTATDTQKPVADMPIEEILAPMSDVAAQGTNEPTRGPTSAKATGPMHDHIMVTPDMDANIRDVRVRVETIPHDAVQDAYSPFVRVTSPTDGSNAVLAVPGYVPHSDIPQEETAVPERTATAARTLPGAMHVQSAAPEVAAPARETTATPAAPVDISRNGPVTADAATGATGRSFPDVVQAPSASSSGVSVPVRRTSEHVSAPVHGFVVDVPRKAPPPEVVDAEHVVPAALAVPPPPEALPSSFAATPVAPSDMIAVAIDPAAATARTSELVDAAAMVADTILVTPSLVQGEGEVVIRLKPTVLDGSEIRLEAKGTSITIDINPATVETAKLIERSQVQFAQQLSERLPSFQFAVNLTSRPVLGRKERIDETA